MARQFEKKEANTLIDEHNKILDQSSSLQIELQTFCDNVRKNSDFLVAQSVMKILQEVPIEEINREKRSFRVKALREHGYGTIADIASVSVYSLASIRGISEDTAYSIKRITNDMVAQARKGCKIRLSTDNQTKETSALVLSLYQLKQFKPIVEEYQNLVSANQSDITNSMTELKASLGFFQWFFSSKSKKQKATEAFRHLKELKDGSYGRSITSLNSAIDNIRCSQNHAAWSDFTDNSIQYFTLLEEINPGILGNDDALYGLPEDLAREIQDECFFPDGLLCQLRRYQEWGVKYVLHQERVLLGDEMGLGKTIQAIATMVSLKNTGSTHFMVVCPASVITNWCREIRKMSRLSVTKVHGTAKHSAFQSWIKTGGVGVTTFETTAICMLPDSFQYSLLVVDEAHYIKNPGTKRTKNVIQLAAHTQRLLFMTGTALENRVDEMVSLINILQPRISAQIHGMKYLSTAPQFRKAVAPVYYRRKREDVLTELPELIESKEWCAMNATEEIAYEQAVLSRNYAESRRVSWNVPDLSLSSKAERLLELVEDAESDGRKVIVFSFFLDTIRKITSFLGKRCTNPINGSVSPQRRQEIIDEFDKSPAGTVLVAQIQSGGTGLNIQSASVVIICEPQFKPSIENQAISRAYRMGQTRNVLVYRLLCENTVDEKITALLEHKQAVFDAFADKSEAAKESRELDEQTFGNMIQEEIDRINAKKLNIVSNQIGADQ